MSEIVRFNCETDKDIAGNRLECCQVDCKKAYESHCQHCKKNPVELSTQALDDVVAEELMKAPAK
jgi:hypothetical protein